jgi:hypothetical protein
MNHGKMWRRGLGVAMVGAILAAGGAAVADKGPKGPKAVRQAAQPFAFNLKNDPQVGDALAGGAILDRTRNVLRASVSVTGLTQPNAPYTAWWVVFNKPAACDVSFACGPGNPGPGDLANPAANVAVFHAAGFFTDANGAANFNARVRAGRLADGVDVFLNDGDGVGLERNKGLKAEIHIVIRGHGPTDLASAAEQVSLFNGGCVADPGTDPDDACEDEQVFVFRAP